MPIIRKYDWRTRIPALFECPNCGRCFELLAFTNTCQCGKDYNQGGQGLAPRDQWGEDTGESLADILSIGHYEDQNG